MDEPGSKVLIVDDTLANLQAIQGMLDDLKMPSSLAQSGHVALEMCRERRSRRQPMFKLIILDL